MSKTEGGVIMSIGQRLRTARKARGMSQDMLAEKIGASRGVITNIEHDKIDRPQSMVVNAICNVLAIDKDWLLNGTGTMDLRSELPRSQKVLAEIYEQVQLLSEEEQLFILDLIHSYTKHIKN